MKEQPFINAVSGIFVEAENPQSLSRWYGEQLGLTFHHWRERQSYGAELVYREEPGNAATRVSTVVVFEPRGDRKETTQAAPEPRSSTFKIQLRVPHLDRLLDRLKSNGVAVSEAEDHSFGSFARIRDPEGNRLELYQPR